MDIEDRKLLDCAHVNQIAGICQYNDCSNTICESCLASCDACLNVLCPPHQRQPYDNYPVVCEDHITYILKKRLQDAFSNR
jgi:hypothetical protein